MTDNSYINVTIIIPHYNSPDLLDRCIQSIPIRDDIQIIVVDDCSPISFDSLKKHLYLSHPSVEIYKTPIGGSAGRARNIGLDHAQGKWLLFADADDLFVNNLSDIFDSKINAEEDLIFFRKISVLSSDLTEKVDRGGWNDKMIDLYLRNGDETDLRRSFYAPWCKMIKREIVVKNNIRFDETRYSNDAFFSVSVGLYSKRIAVENYPIYVLTVREGSLVDNFCKKPGELDERANVCIRVQELLKKHDFPVDLKFLSRFAMNYYKEDNKNFHYFIKRIKALNIGNWHFFKEILYNYKINETYKLIIWLRFKMLFS